MHKIKTFQDFLQQIKSYNNRIALVGIADDTQIDYQNLVKEVYNLSYFLTTQINPGDRVVINKLTDINWVKSFFAIILAGGIVVPIDSRISENMLRDILELTKPSLILSLENNQTLENYKIIRLNELDRIYQKTKLPNIDPNSPCQIVFTSGTWAKPKGVTLSQHNLISNLLEITENLYKPKLGERFLSVLPLAHIYEQMAGLLVPLYCGGEIYYLHQITPAGFRNALQKARPNCIIAVPRVLQLIQNSMFRQAPKILTPQRIKFLAKISRKLRISTRKRIFAKAHQVWGGELQTLVVGGASLDIDLDRFFQGTGLKILVGYGMSEASPLISGSLDQDRETSEVGKVLSNMEVKLNSESEILIKGPNVFLGYWPDLNRSGQEFFNTQDVGEFSKKGSLILKGRTKNLIIYGSGDKIFAEDVEYLANQLKEIEEVCLVNISTDEIPELYLVYTGKNIDSKMIITELKSKLPFFIQIKGCLKYTEDKLPVTHTLKTNRKLIRDWAIQQIK